MWLFPQTNVQLRGKSAIPAVATITTMPYANAKRPRDHPETTEAQRYMAGHPGTTGQGALQTTGKDPADPSADAHATAHLAAALPQSIL